MIIYIIGKTLNRTAVWNTVLTLCSAASFKDIKIMSPKCCSTRFHKTPETATQTESKQIQPKKLKYLATYSVNISLNYTTKPYCLYVSKIHKSSHNCFCYTTIYVTPINSRKSLWHRKYIKIAIVIGFSSRSSTTHLVKTQNLSNYFLLQCPSFNIITYKLNVNYLLLL